MSSPNETSAPPAFERIELGDAAAYEDLVRAHQDAVARYCARFVGDVSIAADLTQDVFLTVWNERGRYRERGQLRNYLFTVARNRCLAFVKKRRNRKRLAARWQLPERTVDGTPSEARHIDRALAALPPKQRDLIILRYLEELELADIATITGAKLGTVKSRLSRAVAALRKELSDD